MKLNEVRKEDELYFQGPFWIEGESVRDIKLGNFNLISFKYPCDINGTQLSDIKNNTHKEVWDRAEDFDYYPRGRVGIFNGIAYINLHSLFNQPDIIDSVIKEYNLEKLEIEVKLEDEKIGHHYQFKLKGKK